MIQPAGYSDLPEFGVAHSTDVEGGTGCTMFVAPEGAVGAVDVRGGGPATRETDLLKPENMIETIHGVILSGGSAFGLEAACGAMEVLASESIGFKLGPACVPIVCGASLFDLLVGQNTWPDKAMGAQATRDALAARGTDPAKGNVGAGCGATVGKMGLPSQAMKSGFGWCGSRQGDLVVIANVAVNAAGNILEPDGQWLAGTLDADGVVMDPFAAATLAQQEMARAAKEAALAQPTESFAPITPEGSTPTLNTTLGCILTNAKLSKAQATKVAQIAQDAYARTIKPVHTLNDGDTIFVMVSGKVDAETDVVGILATDAMQCAIRSALYSAQGAYGLKAVCDLPDFEKRF